MLTSGRFSCNILFVRGPMVKRLRHRPFTAVTGVRVSLGSPLEKPHLMMRFFLLQKKDRRCIILKKEKGHFV